MCCSGRIGGRERLDRDAAAFKLVSASPRPQICWIGALHNNTLYYTRPLAFPLSYSNDHYGEAFQGSFHPQIRSSFYKKTPCKNSLVLCFYFSYFDFNLLKFIFDFVFN